MKAPWTLILIAACGAPPPRKSPGQGAPAAPSVSNVVEPPATGARATATPPPTGATVGTAHPLVVEAVARNGAWVVICQARADTDGDGSIGLNVGFHGDVSGDDLTPFVVRHDGAGEPIDLLVDHQRDRWLVALRQGKLAIFDALNGSWQELRGADVRDDGVPLGRHRAASVAAAADRMVYFRDDQTMIVRELATGAEKVVTVPGAKLWRVEVEPLGHWAVVLAIRNDTDGDGTKSWPSVQTSLSARGCRGPIRSYSTGGWSGDTPDELWLDLAAGAIAANRGGVPRHPPPDPELGEVNGRRVLAIDADGRTLLAPADQRRGIPDGPLEWVKSAP